MPVRKINEISNNVAEYLNTKDKSVIRRFIFLFKSSEDRVVFVLLYKYYIKHYISSPEITRDDLFNAILNEKTNKVINNCKHTIFEPYNLNKTIYKKIPL